MALLVTSVLGSTACGEDIFDVKWVNSSVQTVLIYSLTRPELNLPSGYDFVNRNPIEVQRPGATGFWDLLVDTRDGELLFFPPGALGIESEVMILALPDTTFDAVLEAPQDSTLYTKDQPLLIQPGTVFILRTHVGASQFGVPCAFWGKIETTEVEPALGTVVFIYDVSPLCDDRGLVPNG
jgi:hypothetical protein